jgi:fucose permease
MRKGNSYLPIILVTSLFFLWGLAYGLLDVLNKHFSENLTNNPATLYFITSRLFPYGFTSGFIYDKGRL